MGMWGNMQCPFCGFSRFASCEMMMKLAALVTCHSLVSGTRKKNCHMSLSFFFFLFFFNQFQTPRPHRGSQVF